MSSNRSSTRLPLAADGLFSGHPEGTRRGIPLPPVEEDATVVDSSWASSTAALRREGVRGGLRLGHEEEHAADGLFSGHPEGTRGGIPLPPVEEDATVVDSSWASSTAALRREGVRGGLRLGHEEEHAAVVDTSQASSSTAALRREGVRRLGHEEEAAALRGQAVALGRQEDATKALVLRGEHGTRGGLPLEEPTGGIQGLPTPGLRSSTGALGGHGTRGGLAREEPTGGIQGLPTPGLRSSKSTAALPTRGAALNPQAMMPCGSSSSADNKGGGLSIDDDEKRQFQAILQNLNTNEPSSIRSICRTALKLYHDGQNGLALAISEYLVGETKCPENTVALNLCAGLHHNEGAEAMQLVHGGDKKASRAAAFHYSWARTHYEAAARLAPRCIVTAVAHGKVLAVSQLFASAQQELQRASSISIGSADDPAKHNVGCDIRLRANSEEILHTTPVARIGKAHAEAVREVQEFESMICDKYIPSICTDSLMQLETGNCTLEQVLGLAQSMSHHFKYCIRAHLFLTYVQLLCLEGSDEGMVTMKLEDALVTLKENTKTYRNSLFTAFLRAKILLMAGNLIDASTEVCRALDVRAPSDPKTEDIPVGFVEGVDAYGRTSFMRKILEDMLTHIRVSEEPNQEDNDSMIS
ncbi:hypothetical protein ZWY2020_010129 [Hordeum vulgare]|nr:hypothetical protein ZWY2020_010129 [Hordeum vulgare]